MITTIQLPPKLIFGAGSLPCLGTEAAALGSQALLVTGVGRLRSSGVLDKATKQLEECGVAVTFFEGVMPNPLASKVDEGARLAEKSGADMIIGLGGGSVMDAAKGIVAAASGGQPVWYYIKTEKEVSLQEALPLILVPTVAASGSEANGGAVITNESTREKMVLRGQSLFPKVSIVDPELTLTMSPAATARGGVDIFCHLVEPYLTAGNPSPLTDGIVETALKLLVEYLPQAMAHPEDINARSHLSWLAAIACSSVTSIGGGDGDMTLHGLEHALSGYYGITHADGLAALLPAWMRYTTPVRKERFVRLGKKVFGGADGIAAVEGWLKKVGMNLNLEGLGVEKERLPELAVMALATADWLSAHPRPLDEAAIKNIYAAAF